MKPDDLKQIMEMHENHWDDQRRELLRYKAVYETNFWDEESDDKTQMRIQTNDGYGYVEGIPVCQEPLHNLETRCQVEG